MKEIDIKWMQRIDAVHDKLKRSIPLDSKTSRCTKEILIDRYFSFLQNQAFKLQIPINLGKYKFPDEVEYETFYAWFNKTKHTVVASKKHEGEVHYSYGVQKYNGWNDHEFTISFRDEKLKSQEFKLHWNEIMRIQYERIPLQKYWEVVGLFIDIAKPKETIDECKFFDEAQGKHYCTSDISTISRCVGTDCGYFKRK